MMNKWWIFTLILMVCLTGCNNGLVGERTDDQSAIEMQHNYSVDEIYLGDIRVVDLLTLEKEQISDKMGEYVIFYGLGDDEDREGYYYLNYDVTIYYNEAGLLDVIKCGELVNIIESKTREEEDIIELKVDMRVSELKSILGEEELIDLRDGNLPFALIYKYKEFSLRFTLTEESGYVLGISIYCLR